MQSYPMTGSDAVTSVKFVLFFFGPAMINPSNHFSNCFSIWSKHLHSFPQVEGGTILLPIYPTGIGCILHMLSNLITSPFDNGMSCSTSRNFFTPAPLIHGIFMFGSIQKRDKGVAFSPQCAAARISETAQNSRVAKCSQCV